MIKKEDLERLKKKAVEYIDENRKVLKLFSILLVLLLVSTHIRGCMLRNRKAPVYPRPVQTAKAFKEDVPLHVDSFGTLSSPASVDIKAQVTGKILEVNFEQGKEMKKGDLLFTIDPSEYKASLDKAKAALEQDQVTLQLKTDTFNRNSKLFEKNLISEQDFESYKTDMAAAQAQVELDKANLELAEINLGYCYITSPVDGLAGKRQVDVGNIISENTGPTLVNVKIIDTLYFDFTLPEKDLPKVRKAMSEGTLEIDIQVVGEYSTVHKGQLDFIDNKVDDETGTFALRATVKNEDRDLWPGQFATVKLIVGMAKDAVVMPFDAAQIGKKGYYAFVVTKKNKADLREITIGQKDDGNVIVEKGIEAGETVITVGQLGLSPGMPVVDMARYEKKKKKKKK